MTGDKLPPADWQGPKDFDAFASVSSTNGPFLDWALQNATDLKAVLGDPDAKSQSNKDYTIQGSKDAPIEYAPKLYVWGGSVLATTEYGILLGNGSNVKLVSVIDGVEHVKYGVVKDWRIRFDDTDASTKPTQ